MNPDVELAQKVLDRLPKKKGVCKVPHVYEAIFVSAGRDAGKLESKAKLEYVALYIRYAEAIENGPAEERYRYALMMIRRALEAGHED